MTASLNKPITEAGAINTLGEFAFNNLSHLYEEGTGVLKKPLFKQITAQIESIETE